MKGAARVRKLLALSWCLAGLGCADAGRGDSDPAAILAAIESAQAQVRRAAEATDLATEAAIKAAETSNRAAGQAGLVSDIIWEIGSRNAAERMDSVAAVTLEARDDVLLAADLANLAWGAALAADSATLVAVEVALRAVVARR